MKHIVCGVLVGCDNLVTGRTPGGVRTWVEGVECEVQIEGFAASHARRRREHLLGAGEIGHAALGLLRKETPRGPRGGVGPGG
jgi:hypothetical protein